MPRLSLVDSLRLCHDNDRLASCLTHAEASTREHQTCPANVPYRSAMTLRTRHAGCSATGCWVHLPLAGSDDEDGSGPAAPDLRPRAPSPMSECGVETGSRVPAACWRALAPPACGSGMHASVPRCQCATRYMRNRMPALGFAAYLFRRLAPLHNARCPGSCT